jgi:hypothetical protein
MLSADFDFQRLVCRKFVNQIRRFRADTWMTNHSPTERIAASRRRSPPASQRRRLADQIDHVQRAGGDRGQR